MWVWPLVVLAHGGRKQLESHSAHRVATALTMTKQNPHVKKIDMELREIRIKQLEKETGIGQGNKE
jgi:hypothetical protein